MKLLYQVTVISILVLFVSGCGDGTNSTGTVTGTVILNSNGMDGVSVVLSGNDTGNDSATTTTQNGGKYSFSNLRPGTYTVTAEQVGYAFASNLNNMKIDSGSSLTCNIAATKLGVHVPEDAATLQSAIDQATNGQTIYVADGIYHGTGNVAVNFNGKAVTLRSKYGPSNCIVDCGGANQGFILNNNEDHFTVIQGFTIKNCQGGWGAAVDLAWAHPTISGNIFDNNSQAGFGAAIGGNGSSPIIEKNIFTNNACDSQYLSGVVSFVNGSSPLIQSNIFHDNSCRAINMTLPTGNSPKIINNTIVRNPVGIHVDRRVDTNAQIFQNNIITNNTIGLEVVFGDETYNPTWKYNLIYDNLTDYDGIADQTNLNGNISVNPLFIDSLNNNFRLQQNSHAIDAGLLFNAPSEDFDGISRPQRNGIDIGAYEYH